MPEIIAAEGEMENRRQLWTMLSTCLLLYKLPQDRAEVLAQVIQRLAGRGQRC